MPAGVPFDELAANLDPAMIVVTAACGDERDGCLVGFHAQCSISPRRYAVWLSVKNHTHGIAQRCSVLAVHFLAAHQRSLAELFGGETADDGVDKLAQVGWAPGPEGVPLIDDVPHRFAGRVVRRDDSGECDHTMFELEPIESEWPGPLTPFRFSAARDIDAGHPA